LEGDVSDNPYFIKGPALISFSGGRTSPGTLDWWAEAEAEAEVTATTGKSSGAQFTTEYSYAEIRDAERRQGDVFLGAFDQDPAMDAECGTWCSGS
jgi:hypothetical protein